MFSWKLNSISSLLCTVKKNDLGSLNYTKQAKEFRVVDVALVPKGTTTKRTLSGEGETRAPPGSREGETRAPPSLPLPPTPLWSKSPHNPKPNKRSYERERDVVACHAGDRSGEWATTPVECEPARRPPAEGWRRWETATTELREGEREEEFWLPLQPLNNTGKQRRARNLSVKGIALCDFGQREPSRSTTTKASEG